MSRVPHTTPPAHRAMGLLAGLVLLAACETSVDPLVERGRYYGLFGYLDAGADTQFVRVRPLWEPLTVPDGPLDAVVTLENLSTGETTAWRDSLFRFAEGPAHVFWSTVPIAYGTAYRLTATRSDGATATARVTTPAPFTVPAMYVQKSLFIAPKDQPFIVRIDGASRLADVRLEFVVELTEPPFEVLPHNVSLQEYVSGQPGAFEIGVIPYDLFFEGRFERACPVIRSARLFVAATDADWPELEGVDRETEFRPDVVRNVENGVGYLGAVTIETLDAPELANHLNALREQCQFCVANPNHWQCAF